MALHEAGEAQHAAEVAQLNARVASNTAATTAGAEATRLSETERSAIRAECEQKLQFSLDRERAEATLAVERARIEALTATEMLQRIKTEHGARSDGDLQRQRAHAPLRARAPEYGAARPSMRSSNSVRSTPPQPTPTHPTSPDTTRTHTPIRLTSQRQARRHSERSSPR